MRDCLIGVAPYCFSGAAVFLPYCSIGAINHAITD